MDNLAWDRLITERQETPTCPPMLIFGDLIEENKMKKKFCKCGCGQEVAGKIVYVYGHKKYGSDYKSTQAFRDLQDVRSKRMSGIPLWPKGTKFSDEHRAALSEAHKEIPWSPEQRTKLIKAMTGKRHSDRHRNAIALGLQRDNPYDGYGYLFRHDKEFREDVLKDVCEICGASKDDILFNRHHIDLDKTNNHPDNIQTLCVSCHTRLHHSLRRDQEINHYSQFDCNSR